MTLSLTALGTSASMPAAGDACSGSLVSSGETNILLDCGTGVVSAWQRVCALRDVAAIVISHFHPDHFIDLVPLRYGLRYGLETPLRPRVFLPPGGIGYLAGVGLALRGSREYFSSAYDLAEYAPDSTLTIGEVSLTFCQTTHDIPTYAMAVRDADSSLVYTADTQESDDLIAFARSADLLLSESTYPSTVTDLPSGNHLTSRQAGELAASAGVGRLVLTHFWPGIPRHQFLEDARNSYSGDIALAEPGITYSVGLGKESAHVGD